MKQSLYILLIILLFSCNGNAPTSSPELEELYQRLDQDMARSDEYAAQKEKRISELKKAYALSADNRRRTVIIDSLIYEFSAYNADSTLYYIGLNLSRPDVKKIPGEYTRLMIKRADQYAHAALFPDAMNVLKSIPRDSLTDDLLEDYYSAYCGTFQYLSEYTSSHETSLEYENKRALYSDSLRQVTKPGSFNDLCFVMSEKARNGEGTTAIEGLSGHLDEYEIGTREFSMLASTLAFIYKTQGKDEEYKRYLALSAISDVRAAVKENMSFREMATVMFEEGDVERANRYLKKSISDANFYSAPMRNAQSSKILPVIDDAYDTIQHNLMSRLRMMVILSGFLSVILVLTVLFILKQFNSVKRANRKVQQANEELSQLSEQLKDMNRKLEDRNTQLADYNRTKEEYVGLFMEYCSTAITTLKRYQQSLRVSAAQGGNRSALIKKLESSDVSEQLLKDFYVKFDEAILNIFPSFIEKFNALLLPNEQVVLKSGELLNTELRLFALIRIGIDDSAKIAEFLGCSISTVYTYRSKMRKRAIRPDDFEKEVKNV